MASTNVRKSAAFVLNAEIGQRLLDRLAIVRLQPKAILHLGLGISPLNELLEKYYRKAIILNSDPNQQTLQAAKKACRWRTRQRFILSTGYQLPLPDASIDLIISNLNFHHYQNLPGIFQELQRVLKPEGLLQFSTFGRDTFHELQASSPLKAELTGNWVDLHDIGDMLLKTHFTDPVIDMETITFTYSKMPDLVEDLVSVMECNFGYTLASDRKNSIDEDRYETFRIQTGKLPLTFEIVYGHAWGSTAPEIKKALADEVHIPIHTIRVRK